MSKILKGQLTEQFPILLILRQHLECKMISGKQIIVKDVAISGGVEGAAEPYKEHYLFGKNDKQTILHHHG